MNTIVHWLLLAVAGGLGTVARAGVTNLAVRLFGTGFPWGTLAVNILGALLLGPSSGRRGRAWRSRRG